MTTLYRVSNVAVGLVVATVLGGAVCGQLSTWYTNADQAVPAVGIVLGMIAVVAVGWFTIESRKY